MAGFLKSTKGEKPGAGWSSNKALFQVGIGKTLAGERLAQCGFKPQAHTSFYLPHHIIAVPMEVHEVTRLKVVDAFAAKGISTGIVLLKGGGDLNQYDSDIELLFR